MNIEIKKIGNSSGLILPKELLARLRLDQGDKVTVTETPDGFVVSRSDPDDDETIEIARQVMKKYAATFRALAK